MGRGVCVAFTAVRREALSLSLPHSWRFASYWLWVTVEVGTGNLALRVGEHGEHG